MARLPNGTIDRIAYIARSFSKPLPVHYAMLAALEASGLHQGDIANDALSAWFWRPHHGPSAEDEHWKILTKALDAIRPHLSRTPYDRYLPWVAQQVNRMLKDGLPRPDVHERARSLVRSLRAIAEWAEAEAVDLSTVDALTALAAARAYGSQRDVDEVVQGQVLLTFEDGFTVQELSTRSQLRDEGSSMQHCTGRYGVENGWVTDLGGDVVRIFSLRDDTGEPHVTMEFDPKRRQFVQIRGKQNEDPVEKYWPYVGAFIEHVDPVPGDVPGFVMEVFEEAFKDVRKVESDAAVADELMESAAKAFEARDYAKAVEDATQATSLENEYGADPTTGAVLAAIEEGIEIVLKAGLAAIEEVKPFPHREKLEEVFVDALEWDTWDEALKLWKSNDPRILTVIEAMDDAQEDSADVVEAVSDRKQGMWDGMNWDVEVVVREGTENHAPVLFSYDSSTFVGVDEDGLAQLAQTFASEWGLIPPSEDIVKYLDESPMAPRHW